MDGCFICGRQQVIYANRYGVSYCRRHAPDERECLFCSKIFTAHVINQRYCSHECQAAAAKQRADYTKTWRAENKVCQFCGSEFETKSANHKYCSPDCANQATAQNVSRDRYLIFARDGFRCMYCGKTSFSDGKELHADHVVPRDAGGEDIAANLATACAECNLGKSKNRLAHSVETEILEEIRLRNLASGIPPDRPIKVRGG